VYRDKTYELDQVWYLKAFILYEVLDLLRFLWMRVFCFRLLMEDFLKYLGESLL